MFQEPCSRVRDRKSPTLSSQGPKALKCLGDNLIHVKIPILAQAPEKSNST
ncbi:protein of unknown function [Candidatus Hydrogenisulfobacillus filiaventi]|uniref:Uncharacterized protein n=1 Tax=Candidatus Hydrogenisulfobacillus filiaventi TaxID=2707344 RepID=A0A6F8ZE22_9FIRM|nr:protein of unknown function [Candidatus Hydrogenisulfobacillus filiaventi]